jgi:hypothetical protein
MQALLQPNFQRYHWEEQHAVASSPVQEQVHPLVPASSPSQLMPTHFLFAVPVDFPSPSFRSPFVMPWIRTHASRPRELEV